MEQLPVGQGGLSTGEIELRGKSLRWTYDCGSNQDDALVREIRRAARPGARDLLFLSHLDSDHVSGVDRLLAQCPTREVVLPYLDDTQLLAAAARDAASGRLTGLFREAASDLAGWFSARGVETLTFVRSAPEDGAGGEAGGPIVSPPSESPSEGGILAKWTVPPSPRGSPANPRSQFRVQEVSFRASLQLMAGGSILDWVLIPYVHPPEPQRLARFRERLVEAFDEPLDLEIVANAARSEVGRKKLRGCYDGLWSDHNLVSMTLYSGPISNRGDSAPPYWGYPHPPGLMLTGDAHLDQRGRRQAFFQHYSRFADKVGALMLPHHGSVHNFHEELLDGFAHLKIAFACAGPNDYGHPHPEVRRAVKDAELGYRRVNHKRRRNLAFHAEWGP